MTADPVDIVVGPPAQHAMTDEERAIVIDAAGDVPCLIAAQGDVFEAAKQARVVACKAGTDPGFLRAAPRIEWLHSWAAGIDHFVGDDFPPYAGVLTCSKSNGAIPLAEHSILLMLMLNRQVPRWLDAQRRGTWEKRLTRELTGQTVGIVGLGHAGQDFALKAKAFHMRTLGVKRTAAPVANVDKVYALGDLHAMLGECDWVVITAPYTQESHHLFDAAALAAMKPSAHLVIISRGGIVDEDALLAALREGRIAGAGLDVFATEPLPSDSPLWTAPNILITPHNAATTANTQTRAVEIFADNLRRWRSGKPLRNVVDLATGY